MLNVHLINFAYVIDLSMAGIANWPLQVNNNKMNNILEQKKPRKMQENAWSIFYQGSFLQDESQFCGLNCS